MSNRFQDWGVVMLLCDYAEELGGKLYIIGGGWTHLKTAYQPSDISLAIRFSVPWNQANEPHNITLRLLTEDGDPVRNEQTGENILLSGKMEVGRPAGWRPGTPLHVPLAARFGGLILEPGRYQWTLEIDGTPLTDVAFDVIELG